MRLVKAKDLKPDMVIIGFAFPERRTVMSIQQMPGDSGYEMRTKEGLRSEYIHPSRAYLVADESDDE